MKITTVVPFVAGDNDSQQVELQKERRNSRPEEPCEMKIGDYEMYKVLRPLLLTMRVFGFCSLTKDALSKGPTSISYICYSLLSLMIVYVNANVFLVKLKHINSLDELIPVAGETVWLVSSTFLATMLVVMNVRRKVWQELFTSYKTATGGIWRFTGHALTRKRVYIYVLFCWLWSVLNTGYFIYSEILSSEDLALSILSLVGIVHLSICWVAPFAIVMTLTDILTTNFGQFNARLTDAYNSSSLESLGVIRSMHLRLSRMVVVSDNILCRITAAYITSNLLMLSCMIYIVIYNIQDFKSDPVSIVFYLNWIIGVCLILFGTMAACARVKEEAHAAFDILLDISADMSYREELSWQMDMFLAKLSGSSIGITAWKLLVIDKNLILSVVGMLITYSVLIIQFKSSLPPSCPAHVNTTVLQVMNMSEPSNMTGLY